MSVVSRTARQKSWQIADELASLLDDLDAEGKALGARLRQLQRARGIGSDEEAARLIGVSYRQYQRWLSGASDPRTSSLKQIAEAFGIPLVELLGEPDKSQLDRIEEMLEQLVGRGEEEELSAEEEADRVIAEAERAAAADADRQAATRARSARAGRATGRKGRGERRAR